MFRGCAADDAALEFTTAVAHLLTLGRPAPATRVGGSVTLRQRPPLRAARSQDGGAAVRAQILPRTGSDGSPLAVVG
jgi:hypothetical protein